MCACMHLRVSGATVFVGTPSPPRGLRVVPVVQPTAFTANSNIHMYCIMSNVTNLQKKKNKTLKKSEFLILLGRFIPLLSGSNTGG